MLLKPGQPGVVVHAYDASTCEAEEGESPQIQGQPGLHGEFLKAQAT